MKKGPELNLWRAPLANETDEWDSGQQITSIKLMATGVWLPLNGILPVLIN